MTVLVRTVVAESKTQLEARVAAARREGWEPIGNPGHLSSRGRPSEGPASWLQSMEKRS